MCGAASGVETRRRGPHVSLRREPSGSGATLLFDPAIEALFAEVCELDPTARDARLAEVPTDLRQQVKRLLELDDRAEGVFVTDGGQQWLGETTTQDVPERVGAFRIVRRLGMGGMGIVYEAEQEHPRRRVALKVVHPRLRTPEVLDWFHFEAQALAQVVHPGVPNVYEAGTTADGTVYLSMELVDGRSLRDWARQTRASLQRRIRLLIDVSRAVAACHAAKVIHRDLKPSNILVTDDDVPIVLDFGVAMPHASGPETHPGTPGYMSPEARRGDALDVRSDVYALGCIAFELLTGRLPDGPDVPAADAIEPALDPDVSDVLRRALATKREHRTPTATAFAEDLACTLALQPLPWKRGRAYRAGRFALRNRMRIGVGSAVAAMAVLGVLAGYGLQAWQREQREQGALELLDAVRPDLAGPGGEARVRRFVARDDVAGTRAVADAWLAWSDLHRGGSGELDGLAEAYLTASDATQADAAKRRLARRFHETARWDALWQLRDQLTPADRAELAEPLRLAAMALRRFDALAEEGPSPMLEALGQATDLQETAFKAGWLKDELAVIQHDEVRIGSRTVQLAHPQGWTSIENFAVAPGPDGRESVWMATGNGRSNALLYRDFEVVAELPRSTIQQVTVDGGTVFVALSYPERGLVAWDGERVFVPSPAVNALDSDVMDVVATDLKRDGRRDLVVSVGAWEGYALMRLTEGPDRWETVAEVPQGVVMELLVDGDRIYAGKVDMEIDLRRFSEEAPYGPPAGIYVYDLDLTQVDYWPLPIVDDPATGSKRSVEDPVLGDFDGDGVEEQVWTLRHHHRAAEDLLWIVGHGVIAGLEAYDARDVDGDGDDELLVGDEHGRLWLLGAGDGELPPWTGTAELAADIEAPDVAGAARQTAIWRRTDELVALGLVSEAARALGSVPGVVTDPDTAAAYHARAAALHAAAGQPDRAAEQLQKAIGGAPDHSAAASWSERLRTLRLETLDFEGAREVWTGAPDWVEGVERVDLRPHLRFEQPVFRPAGTGPEGSIAATVFNDHGVLARIPVEVTAPWVQLELEVALQSVELGAGMAVDLVRDDATLLTVDWWGQGGGGATWLYQNCGDDQLEWLEPERNLDRITLAAARSSVEEVAGLRCRQDLAGEPRWAHYASGAGGVERRAIPLGPAELVIRAHGDPGYVPPTRARFTIERLDGLGLAVRDGVPTPRQAWLAERFAGRGHEEPAPPELRREAALARGDVETWGRLLREAPAREQAWALRLEGAVATRALEPLGPERFCAVLHASLEEAHKRVDDPEVQDALLRPDLDSLALTTAEGRLLRIWRADVWMARGNPGAARRLLESVAATDSAEALLAER